MTLEQEKQATPKTNGASHQDKDWATDYDIFDPNYIKNPFPVWDELRDKCPVAHTERWGGSWMPTRYADLFAIAQAVSANQDDLLDEGFNRALDAAEAIGAMTGKPVVIAAAVEEDRQAGGSRQAEPAAESTPDETGRTVGSG